MKKIFLFLAAVVCAVSMNAQEPLPSEVLQYGKFSVSSTKQVLFSKGNLQYQADPGSWRFAENQYDVIGADNGNIASDYTGWIDLFGWGTSGYDSKAPYMTSTTNTAYGNGDADIAGTNYDWGVYNKNDLSAPEANWRTLTAAEWDYILWGRAGEHIGSANDLHGLATVDGVKGMILLPDDWRTDYNPASGFDPEAGDWTTNKYDADEWYTMEALGAVFLPAGGYREETNTSATSGAYAAGYYWTSSKYNTNNACSFEFNKEDINGGAFTDEAPCSSNYIPRSQGCNVRLVIDYEAPAVQQYTITLAVSPDPSGSAEFTNGDLSGVYNEGEEVRIQAYSNAQWQFEGWDTDEDGVPDNAAEELVFDATQNITITAFFIEVGGETGIDNVNREAKAVKVLRDGLLIIKKNDKTFNAQGAEVK